ncbi:hypothetical protein H109_02052 [Trichophyton interdigitale MR816]|uniref:Uncharacterized protein n=1 Tax=Trichophyton interdigitale (strain MR816) TaxID=1215338 RepID=A0A059JE29_TRIIM|nr:hypothetical protein H101_05079 [Trichophyton interdigitale H6]KDB26136.1 hypothetical protein H109_02052 [Trichophyton interdigitale MR816]
MGKQTVSSRPRAHTTTGTPKQQPHESPRPSNLHHQRAAVYNVPDNVHNPACHGSLREPRRSNAAAANRSRSAGTYAPKRLSPVADKGLPLRGGQARSIHPNKDPRWNEMIGVALSSPTVDLFPVPPTTRITPLSSVVSNSAPTSAPTSASKREVHPGSGGRMQPRASTAPSTVSSTISNTVTAKKPLQRKPSKWKKFGGLFRAKQVESPQNEFFYQVQVNDKPLRPAKSPNFQPQVYIGNQYPSNSMDAVNSSKTSIDSRSQARQTAHHRHQRQRTANGSDPVSRSHLDLCPSSGRSSSPEESPKQARKRTPAKLVKNAEIRRYWNTTTDEPESAPDLLQTTPSGSPFLSVDIPSIEMERYSVMFGGLIDNNAPSLLARRSRALNKLKIPDKEEDNAPLPPPRRATSPGPARSPVFSLFPSTPTDKQSKILGSYCLPRQSPRQKRSNTHPSPHKSLFERWGHDGGRGGLESPQDLQPPVFPNVDDASDGSLYSPTSYDEEYLNPVRLQVNPPVKLVEPDWEMVTPAQNKPNERKPPKNRYPLLSPTPSSNLSEPGEQPNGSIPQIIHPATPPQNGITNHDFNAHPRVDSLRPKTASSCPPSKSGHKQSLSIDSMSDDLHSDIHTAQISIARSVSVSKGQKKILVPVGARTGFLQPGERFVEKRAGIPTQLAVQRGHRHAKSRNALIENA